MERKLNILLIDDDSPSGCVVALKTALTACLGKDNYWIDHPSTYAKGHLELQSLTVYDLILFDVRLDGEYIWGGCELLDRHWQSIQDKGSKILLYSGKDTAIEAYRAFGSGRGPFLFHGKADELEPGRSFESDILRLLRDRVRSLCQRASLQSAVAVVKKNSLFVTIDEQVWSVESLIAPWLCPLPGEATREREFVLRSLFPGNNLVRVLSYWFKGREFVWPSDAMYGLSMLAPYHLGVSSGPMDALTHDTFIPDVPMRFALAAQTALDDLESLRNKLNKEFEDHLRGYINLAKSWVEVDEVEMAAMASFKSSVMFTLSDIAWIFETKGARIDTSRIQGPQSDTAGTHLWDLIGQYEFYSPAVYADSDGGAGCFHPSLKYAASRLAQSAKKRAGGVWSVAFDIEGELVSFERPTDFPFLLIAVCHAGVPFQDAAGTIGSIRAIRAGHGHALRDAIDAVHGCAHWYILSGETGQMHVYEAPDDPGSLTQGYADELWHRFNAEGIWHVIHVLKIGMPTVRP